MDELSEKLAGLLNDPDTMARVRQMAQGLFSGENEDSSATGSAATTPDMGFMPSAEELGKIMSVMSRLNGSGTDSRAQLLLALKPHLSEPRREKVDNALKILRLLEILPLIKEFGADGGFL